MSQSSYWAYQNIFDYYYTSPQPFFFSSQNWVTNVKHYKTFFFVEPKLFIEQAKPPILSKAQEFLSLAIFEKKKKKTS